MSMNEGIFIMDHDAKTWVLQIWVWMSTLNILHYPVYQSSRVVDNQIRVIQAVPDSKRS